MASFLDDRTHAARDLWVNLRVLDLCLVNFFGFHYDSLREPFTRLLSTSRNLEELRLSFLDDYDQRDDGDFFSEVVRSLREVPLSHVSLTWMSTRKTDLNSLLHKHNLRTVRLCDICYNGQYKRLRSNANPDTNLWTKNLGWAGLTEDKKDSRIRTIYRCPANAHVSYNHNSSDTIFELCLY